MKKIFFIAFIITTVMAGNIFCASIDKMMQVLSGIKARTAAELMSIDRKLSVAARELSSVDIESEDARKILNKLCEAPYVIDCAIVDTTGRMAVVEPQEYKRYEGSDISGQTHIIDIMDSKKPIVSNVFKSVEGLGGIVFEYPIFSSSRVVIGSVNMLVKHEILLGNVIVPLVKDISCKGWIMQKDGIVLYDEDSNQIGRNIFTDELFESFRDLISFSRSVAAASTGAGSYDFYAKGLRDNTIIKKYAVWDTISMYGTEWRIVVIEGEKAG